MDTLFKGKKGEWTWTSNNVSQKHPLSVCLSTSCFKALVCGCVHSIKLIVVLLLSSWTQLKGQSLLLYE